jgi:hypothetical protein
MVEVYRDTAELEPILYASRSVDSLHLETRGARLMKKIHMSREQLVAEAIDLIAEDVQTQAFDGEILPDLLSLIPTEKLIAFLPADEEDEERRTTSRRVIPLPKVGSMHSYTGRIVF